MMDDVKLNLLLLGRTGCGMSSTGNSLLNRRVFKTSADASSETKKHNFSFYLFNNHELLVVDGPGLETIDMDNPEDITAAVNYMNNALTNCVQGFDAFLFVLKFGNRFTREDNKTIESLIQIFGVDFMKHVIVVMTHGDNFQGAMMDQGRDIQFDVWCREQKGFFHQLYEKCERRLVLFNNRETDENMKSEQMRKVVSFVDKIKGEHPRYTRKCYTYGRHEENQRYKDRHRIPAEKHEKSSLANTYTIPILIFLGAFTVFYYYRR